MGLYLSQITKLVAGFLLAALAAACAQGEVAPPDEADGQSDHAITVTVLGTGTPIPTADQYGAAILVQAGGRSLLFDCGRGCTSRLAAVDPRLVSEVTDLFLTHLHSDHIVGVDDLWLNGWTQGRDTPLNVHGPTGTARFFENLRNAYSEDIRLRLEKGIPADDGGIALAMTDLAQDAVVFDQSGVRVRAFLVDHGPIRPAFGFRVDYAGHSVVISGDTTPSENLVQNAEGVDVLLHEVLSPTQVAYVEGNFSPEQADTIIGIHTTAEEAGDVFAATEPGLAVYYHTRNTAADIAPLLEATQTNFDGRVEVAEDLMRIGIGETITIERPD